ncbi:YiiX/YebB-like N1pC/P60 family cysteine hydrolase [Virgibacillus kekensis]|uniref:YiiX/YebB-like N1pC/P60 family cysteine hydrolase n=1 Tax=Virgibacillus kekensis TaxID=202261 RepID=A0ABV9DHN2_9BACI
MYNPVVTGSYTNENINIYLNMDYPIQMVSVELDGHSIGTYRAAPLIRLPRFGGNILNVMCRFADGQQKTFTFQINPHTRMPDTGNDRTFQPGDILIASDNYGNVLPPGYMGHSAIVVDGEYLVESVTSHPQVQFSPIKEFLAIHPQHTQYRCKDSNLAQQAANFAINYVNTYSDKLKNGQVIPPFTFSLSIPLENLEAGVYCSKLVWHCYYQGAGIKFENDHFLFAPEDLATILKNDERFEQVYMHPQFGFKLDA